MSVHKFLDRYTAIEESSVVGQVLGVTLESSDDNSNVTVRGRIRPHGPQAAVLRSLLESDTPSFGMRGLAVRDAMDNVTSAQIVTWDLIYPDHGPITPIPENDHGSTPPVELVEKTCGSCAYLGEEHVIDIDSDEDTSKWEFDVPTGFYKCTYVQHHERPRSCIPTDTLAFVEDGSDYHAALKVKTDFGCVSHKPKLIPVTQF